MIVTMINGRLEVEGSVNDLLVIAKCFQSAAENGSEVIRATDTGQVCIVALRQDK